MTAAPTRAPWQNLRVLTTLATVFLAGAASGALSMQLGLHGWLHRTLSTPAPAPPLQTDDMLAKFDTELGLSQDQSQKVRAVVADWRGYYQSLEEQLDDVRATGRQQILGILTPEQRDKFEKMGSDLELLSK